jgi:fermentation-respiration switch protein FrsA (DUF1100 family)
VAAALGAVALLVVALLVLMFARQEALVFFPGRALAASPADAGLAFETVELVTADAVRLHAWWIPAREASGRAVIVCHGNAGTVAERLDHARLFHGLGLGVLLFDYRGYGRSGGRPSEVGTYRDMDAAVAFLGTRGIPAARTVYFGESLGGAVAIEAATRYRPAAVIVESTFTSIAAMARVHYPFVPGFLVTRVRYDSLARVPALGCPLLVLHSPDDEIVPFAMAERLLDAAPGPKRLVRLAGGHNDGGVTASASAQAALRELLAATVPASADGRGAS